MGTRLIDIGKISLSEHGNEPLRTPEELRQGVEQREIVLVFKNGKTFNGTVTDVDRKHVWVTTPNNIGELSLPFRRLLGWYYESDERLNKK